MRPVEFTPEAIIQAGQDLQTAGRNITGFALRQKVGGGNPSRLKQVWDEHLAGQSSTMAEPVAELPVEVAEEVAAVTKALTDRLAMLAVELNDKAVKAADRRVHEVVRSAGEQREQAERELADASQTVDELETKIDETKAEVEGLEIKLADAQKVSQARAVELAQVRERLAVTEQAATTANEQHTAELVRMNTSIEAERSRHQQEADQVHQEQRKRSADEILRITELTERVKKAETARDVAQRETGTAREDGAKLRGQVEILQTQTAELMRALGNRQEPEATAVASKPTTKTTKK